MIECDGFKDWLVVNTRYSDAAVKDVISRMNRADKLLEWQPIETYIFYLEKNDDFEKMSVSVKSQVRRAVKYYFEFYKATHPDEITREYK